MIGRLVIAYCFVKGLISLTSFDYASTVGILYVYFIESSVEIKTSLRLKKLGVHSFVIYV